VNSTGSYDPDGTIASTSISFGDGTMVNEASASHVYSSPGAYMVTVTVTDNQGATSQAIATVTVNAPGVTISKPAANSKSSVTSVNVVASASALKPISSMMVYVDNNRKYTTYSATVNTYITVPSGTHTILVKAWDSSGSTYSESVGITVK
jgi:PKD repeat protein